MKHLTDSELMKIVQAGDNSPASELYDRYSERIYNFARRILRNDDLAADATQETFFKMMKNAHQFRENSSLPTWLYAVTMNYCRDYFRRSAQKVTKESEEVLRTAPAKTEATDREAERNADIRRIHAALERLTEDQREAIRLARFAEMSHTDIARIVGASAGAVKTRISRGMEALKSYLTTGKTEPEGDAGEGTTTALDAPVEETNV